MAFKRSGILNYSEQSVNIYWIKKKRQFCGFYFCFALLFIIYLPTWPIAQGSQLQSQPSPPPHIIRMKTLETVLNLFLFCGSSSFFSVWKEKCYLICKITFALLPGFLESISLCLCLSYFLMLSHKTCFINEVCVFPLNYLKLYIKLMHKYPNHFYKWTLF